MMRTTSPQPVYRSTRDTRNAPLWNPSSKELTNVEEDEAGRLASFRAKYGRMFDLQKGAEEGEEVAEVQTEEEPASPDTSLSSIGSEGLEGPKKLAPKPTVTKAAPVLQNEEIDDGWDFGEDDENMLDLISSYGQEDIRQQDQPKKKGDGKKGKK